MAANDHTKTGNWVDVILGRPLASEEEEESKIGVFSAVPYLGLDALSSAAYGPEAALTVLIPIGLLGVAYAIPIFLVILAILLVLALSYWQTIGAYPSGGGSYTVARENLGNTAGLFAASALMVDYALDVAVGISAGVGAIVSIDQKLHPDILALALAILLGLTLLNLRGVRSSGIVLATPTYLFIGSLGITLVAGLWRAAASGGHPAAIEAAHLQPPGTLPAAGLLIWLLLRGFASGCTAMTGVEAISNGVPNFSAPGTVRARQTLVFIVGVLGALLIGIMVLCRFYKVGAIDPNAPNYQSIISQLSAAIWGRNWLYYTVLGSTLAVLCFSSNTGFADFPRLTRLLSLDEYLPRTFSMRGRRLVFSMGIVVLSIMTAILLIAFGGITDRLIPLFAVGAFTAFTLSQFGMVVHWRNNPGSHSKVSGLINLVGGICTAFALAVISVAKFAEGAWVSILVIPALVVMFTLIRNNYRRIERMLQTNEPLRVIDRTPPVVIVPMKDWTTVTAAGLQYALRISDDVSCVHVSVDEDVSCKLETDWFRLVEEPCKQAKIRPPQLVVLASPFRKLQSPLDDYIRELRGRFPDRPISVIIPELQQLRWWQYLLHNQRATALKAALLQYAGQEVNVINVPWFIKRTHPDRHRRKRRAQE